MRMKTSISLVMPSLSFPYETDSIVDFISALIYSSDSEVPSNTETPSEVADCNDTEDSFLQPENAPSPTVIADGNEIEVRAIQLPKAYISIEVAKGIETEVSK